jgi:hypothetical protein
MTGLIKVGVWFLEGIFAFGAIGSAVVLVLTTVEDVRALRQKDETPQEATAD